MTYILPILAVAILAATLLSTIVWCLCDFAKMDDRHMQDEE